MRNLLFVGLLLVATLNSCKEYEWKVASVETGVITKKLQPGQHGGLTNEGTPNTVYLINENLYESISYRLKAGDSVLILHYVLIGDTSRQRYELEKM